MKRNGGIRLLCLLLCVVLTALGTVTYDYIKEETPQKKAEAATLPTEEYTEKNPLTVIEIVPYLMFAEFGYHIAGGEPVDYEKLEESTELAHRNPPDKEGVDMKGLMESFCGIKAERIEIQNESSHPLYAFYSKEYFKRYSLGEAYVDDELLKKQAIHNRLEREIASTKDDTFRKNCQKTLEQYTYTSAEKEKLTKFNSVKVVYKAVLVSEVNKNPAMLESADLILITGVCSSGAADKLKPYLKEEYQKKLKHAGDTSYEEGMKKNPYSYDKEEELSFEAADKIFCLSTEIGGTPVIMNRRALDDPYEGEKKKVTMNYTALGSDNERKAVSETTEINGCCNNMYKLFIMLYQKDPYVFRNDYYRYINKKGEFTLQSNDAKSYWTFMTFFDNNYGSKENAGQNYYGNILLTNGMTWNSDTTFYTGYITGTAIDTTITGWGTDTGGCYVGSSKFSKDVVEYFGTDKTQITAAEAIQFLLMNHKRNVQGVVNKETLSVLEIEPSNEFTENEDKIKEYLSGYSGEVKVSYMTSAQFNSTDTDLAGTYDLIVMGANTGGLSRKNANKNIYMAKGDEVKAEVLGRSVLTTYSGNDITEAKRIELKQYLAAGRPILMADDLYDIKQVDTCSNMYTFLKQDAQHAKESNQIVTLSKAEQAPTAATSQLIPYLETARPEISVADASYMATSFSVTFSVSGIKEEEGGYTAALYATLAMGEETRLGTASVSNNGSYTITKSGNIMEDAAPAVSYRLVVAKEENCMQYGSTSGTARRTSAEPSVIRLLQIAPKKTTVDLTSESDIVAEKIAQVSGERIEVTKITTDEFEAMYDEKKGGSKYLSCNRMTDKLLSYDVLVFGCSDDYPVISNANGALDNVIAFVNYHRSVIFTNGAIRPVSECYGTETVEAYKTLRRLAGMKTCQYTNPYITIHKADATAYTMYDISKGDSKKKQAEYATLVNESPVSIYPYQITGTSLAQKTKSCSENLFSAISVKKETASIFPADLSKGKGYYALAEKDESGRMQFSASPNDVQNQYYLYQSGTVWYSGIGSNKLSTSEEEEAKLFVNTIVMAYHGSSKAPTASFVGTDKDADGTDLAFVDADVLLDQVEKDMRLTIKAHDEKGSPVTAKVYVKTGERINKVKMAALEGSSEWFNLSDTKLVSDKNYDIIIPSEYLNAKETTVYLYVENENGIGTACCRIIRRNEFDLD